MTDYEAGKSLSKRSGKDAPCVPAGHVITEQLKASVKLVPFWETIHEVQNSSVKRKLNQR